MSIVTLANPSVTPATRAILTIFTNEGVAHEARQFEETTHTAKDAAERLDCDVGAIASSLVFIATPRDPNAKPAKPPKPSNKPSSPAAKATDEVAAAEAGAITETEPSSVVLTEPTPILVLCSGAHRANQKWLKRYLGARDIAIAPMDAVIAATGQPPGGVAPVGHPQRIRTLVDASLRQHSLLWCGGGDSNTVVSASFDDLVRVTEGEVVAM